MVLAPAFRSWLERALRLSSRTYGPAIQANTHCRFKSYPLHHQARMSLAREGQTLILACTPQVRIAPTQRKMSLCRGNFLWEHIIPLADSTQCVFYASTHVVASVKPGSPASSFVPMCACATACLSRPPHHIQKLPETTVGETRQG